MRFVRFFFLIAAFSVSAWAAQDGLPAGPHLIACIKNALHQIAEDGSPNFSERDFAEVAADAKKLLKRPINPKIHRALEKRWEKVDFDRARLPKLPNFEDVPGFDKRSELSKSVRGKHDWMSKSSVDHAQKNWKRADRLVAKWAREGTPLTIARILQIHATVTKGLFEDPKESGTFRTEAIYVGNEPYKIYSIKKVSKEMNDFLKWYRQNDGKLHPIELAAMAYTRLVSIHPFWDGNGRTTRMIMDWILESHGYPPALIPARENDVAVYGSVVPKDNVPPEYGLKSVTDGVEASMKVLFLED